MTDFDRRDFVKVFTAMMVTGIITKPDEASADGNASRTLWVLFVASIVISTIYIIMLQTVLAVSVKSAKVVSPGKAAIAQRLRAATPIGTLMLLSSVLIAIVSRKHANSLQNKRSLNISIPLPGTGDIMELKARRLSGNNKTKALAISKQRGKKAGTLLMDKKGVIINARKAKVVKK